MSTEQKTRKGIPTRDFNDAGTGETFTEGKAHNFAIGAHANYLAAGLITESENREPAKTPA